MNNNDKYISKELKKIINILSHFPTMNELRKLKRGNLLYKINKAGGINYFRKLLKFNLLQVPNGYYEDFTNVVNVINDYINVYKKFPTINALDKFKHGIKFAIQKYHGGYRNVRDKLGIPQLMKQDGYWRNFKNIRKEILIIKNTIGVFPSVEDIKKYGPAGLYAGICLYHSGLPAIQKKIEFKVNPKSILEQKVKFILDQYVLTDVYQDNGKKSLYRKYGINLINPNTQKYLELDRYYPEYRVAIEVQGLQHEEEIPYFAKMKGMSPSEYLNYIKLLDKEKQRQCTAQKIELIYIYDNMSKNDILNKISNYLPLRTSPLKIKSNYSKNKHKTQKQTFLKLENEKGSALTSNDIKEYSQKFYKDLLLDYGTLSSARQELGIAPLREHRNYWTLEKVTDKILNLIDELGKFPRKEDILKYDTKLYYGIVKHGGLRKFKNIVIKS